MGLAITTLSLFLEEIYQTKQPIINQVSFGINLDLQF